MRATRRALSGLLTIALSACTAVGPDYRRPDAPVPAAFRHAPAAPSGWKFAEPAQADAEAAWWRDFQDRSLDALVAAADQANQDLQGAAARVARARALLGSAQSQGGPSVDASASAARTRILGGPDGNRFRAGLEAGWEPDLWGLHRRAIESGDAELAASEADLAAARLAIHGQLVRAYIRLRADDALRRLLETTVDAYQQSLRVTRNRYEAGVVPRSDVAQAQTLLRSTQVQLIEVGISRAQTLHAMAVLLGRAPSALTIAADDRLPSAPAVPVGLPSGLLERRPDIAAAERRVAAANARIGVAQAAWYPTITLGASVATQGTRIGDLLALPNRVWSLGPALVASLIDGGAREARRAEAIAAYDEAVAGYRMTVLEAFREVEDALVAMRLLQYQVSVQRRAEQAAAEALEQVSNQYEAGTASFLNLLTAQTALLAASRTLVELRARLADAGVRLTVAAGGGWRQSAASAPRQGQLDTEQDQRGRTGSRDPDQHRRPGS
ncbi:MAG: efflux transporter outer membrane subunit [Burkholderiaceae bacterium]